MLNVHVLNKNRLITYHIYTYILYLHYLYNLFFTVFIAIYSMHYLYFLRYLLASILYFYLCCLFFVVPFLLPNVLGYLLISV